MTTAASMDTNKRGRPLGRPPASNGAQTRSRIMLAARRCFALHGYDNATYKQIAADADLTTGAIHHYFASKQDLFVAVSEATTAVILATFREAAEGAETLMEKLKAILESAVELHRQDPSLSLFAAAGPTDLQRHPELRAAIGGSPGGLDFFAEVVRDARRRGELIGEIPDEAIVRMLMAVSLGMAQVAAQTANADEHRRTIDAFAHLVEGSLSQRAGHRRERRR